MALLIATLLIVLISSHRINNKFLTEPNVINNELTSKGQHMRYWSYALVKSYILKLYTWLVQVVIILSSDIQLRSNHDDSNNGVFFRVLKY